MGGFGSGGFRWGKRRIKAEGCYQIDAEMLRAGGIFARVGRWEIAYNGLALGIERRAGAEVLHLEARLNGASGRQVVRVSWEACRYGGRRAWLHCPNCGRRVLRLFLYPHLVQAGRPLIAFLCRGCLGLTYRSKNESNAFHRAMLRAGKIRRRLGGSSEYHAAFPDKPRWMRWPTYDRLFEKHTRAVMEAEATWLADAARRFPELWRAVERERAKSN